MCEAAEWKPRLSYSSPKAWNALPQGVDSLDAVTPVHLLHVTVGLAAGGKGGRLADMADLVDKADLGR